MNAPNLQNPIQPWENDYWTPEALFKGETVFVAASGPSLTQEIADKLKGRRVIAVNSSCMLFRTCSPVPVLYFTDSGWYADRRALVATWPGLVVSMARLACRELNAPGQPMFCGRPRILRVKGIGAPPFPPRVGGEPGFPPLGSPGVQQGRNSGNTAVALAIAMGAARICMVGFDCRVVAGREHFHSEYSGPRDLSLYDNEFKSAFDGWHAAALNSGVEIVNCTDGSAITEFPFADLDEVLR